MRARQILEGNNEYHDNVRERFPTHYDCTLTEADKRKFTPWLLEKCIANCTGSKPVYQIKEQNSIHSGSY